MRNPEAKSNTTANINTTASNPAPSKLSPWRCPSPTSRPTCQKVSRPIPPPPRAPAISPITSPQGIVPPATGPTDLLMQGRVVRLSDGEFKLVAEKPVLEVALGPAARMLGISKSSVRRLCASGFLEYRRPTPRRTMISVESIRRHHARTSDPQFWENHAPEKGLDSGGEA